MNKRIIHSVFENQVQITPNNMAVVEGVKKLTYKQLNEKANRLACVLKDVGIGRGSIVCTILPAGINLVTSLIGIFKSLGIYMPLDLELSRNRLQQALAESKISCCITDVSSQHEVRTLLSTVENMVKYLLVLNDRSIIKILSVENDYKDISSDLVSSTENPVLLSQPDDGNYIFYTSGSTGGPKAILGCHDSLSHCVHWEIKEFKLTSDFCVSLLNQPTFDASLRDIFVPLCAGATLCIPTLDARDNLSTLTNWIAEEGISIIHTVPSLFRAFIKEIQDDDNLSSRLSQTLKHVLLAGEPIYTKDILRWRNAVDNAPEIVNLYGTTEATMFKTFHRIKELPKGINMPIHVGKPISNSIIAVINDDMLCEKGEIGEIYICTPFLSKGYFNNEQKTKEVFIQNPLVTNRNEIVYKTGDFGRYVEGSNLEVLGRIDNQVKINGIRVELDEIKQAVLSCDGVEEVEMVVKKDDDHQNVLICYFVGSDANSDDLQIFLQQELNRNVLPSSFIQLDEFPLTINGKVDKRALPIPEEFLIKDADYEETVSETERNLELMCLDILGVSRIGRKISFFKVGGTSLKAMQYISRIYKEYGININLRDVFEQNSIKELGAFLEKKIKASAKFEEIPKVSLSQSYELSHAQKRLWLVSQFDSEKLKYNMSYALRVQGDLKIDVLHKVMNTLIGRHEILRTTIETIDGIQQQKIHDQNADFNISTHDIRKKLAKERLLETLIDEELHTVFDLSKGPLMRLKVVQTEDNEFILILSLHHIVADGWSLEILQKECFELYRAYCHGEDNPLEPLRIQYKDFAHWQNNQLTGKRLESLETYWLKQLSGDLKPVEMPADYSRNLLVSVEGDFVSFEFDAKLSQQLQKLAEENEATMFILMTALVNLLLARYTGLDDIIIGTPAASRKHPDLEKQIGLYINVIPLRIRSISKENDFNGLLKSVKQVIIDAYEHDLYPYDLLIEKLGLANERSRFPLISVLVQSQEMFTNDIVEIAGLSIKDYEVKCLTSKVDITFNFKQIGERVGCSIEYDTKLFHKSTINKIIENLLYFANAVAPSGYIQNSAIELLLGAGEEEERNDFMKSMMNI